MISSVKKPKVPIAARSGTIVRAPERGLPTRLRASPEAIDPAFVGDPIHSLATQTSATAEAGSKKRRFYKPLPIRFQHCGFDYREIYRKGDFAIYKQTWKGNKHSAGFEVVRIRRREGFQIGNRFVEPAEVHPNSEAWGVDGWTALSKGAAFRKLRDVVSPEVGR